VRILLLDGTGAVGRHLGPRLVTDAGLRRIAAPDERGVGISDEVAGDPS
jgi:uncharacterized protein YbjT (DUF2867 family)